MGLSLGDKSMGDFLVFLPAFSKFIKMKSFVYIKKQNTESLFFLKIAAYLQKRNDFFHNGFNLPVQLLSINSRTWDGRNFTYGLLGTMIFSNRSFCF